MDARLATFQYVRSAHDPCSARKGSPMSRHLIRGGVVVVLLAAVTVLPPPAPASAASAYFVPDDHCLGQCHDILPPGQNGNATLVEILASQLLGTRPAHSGDQLAPYANLLSAYTGLT